MSLRGRGFVGFNLDYSYPEMNSEKPADIIVIGAGPAGLMAAGQAASVGGRVWLLEKMDQPGRKLRITGMGRCNLTNTAGLEDFIGHFGPSGVFLRQAFARFFSAELVDFLSTIGISTAVERGGRVFPVEDDAASVAEKLVAWTKSCGVVLRCGCPVEVVVAQAGTATGVRTRAGEWLPARAVILATGGASYTGTGSTGDGYHMAAALGHTILPLRPALVPIKTLDGTARRLQGLALRNARVRVLVDAQPRAEEFGELMFTHFGLSGPVILTLSGMIVDAWQAGKKVEISIDLKPALDEAKLDARLLRELDTGGAAPLRSALKRLLPRALILVYAELAGLDADKPCGQVTAVERQRLRAWLKDFRLVVSGHLPLEAGMVTAGGIALEEVDPRTLGSRLVGVLYFAGEVLDLAADTGGFNLQAAFSTGWLAGRSAAQGARDF